MEFHAAIDQYVSDTATQQQVRERLDAVLARSSTDLEFRRKLVENPREAIAEFKGVDASTLPDQTFVRFIDDGGVPTVILPQYAGDGNLSDAELEAVAGGMPWFAPLIYMAIGALLV